MSAPVPSSDLLGRKTAEGARMARSYILATVAQRKYLDILLETFAPIILQIYLYFHLIESNMRIKFKPDINYTKM
jgi:hypothetical protein